MADASSTRPYVQIPVTWNDADREGGIDHWIAVATFWHDQCQEAWHTRDMVADLQERIDRVLALCGDADTGCPAMVAKMLRGESPATDLSDQESR